MLLQEFDTLEDAHSFSKTTYSDITSNQAEQFFGLSGYIDALENAVDNSTVVTVIGGMPTTIGKLIKTVLKTMIKSGGVFVVDVNTDAGQLNRACATILHAYDVLPEHVTDEFIGLGEIVEQPYVDITPEQFAACKDAYSELTTKTRDWDGQQYLRVTLHDDLYEPKNTTLFFTNSIFTNENLGVPKRLDKADVYIFDLSKVRKGAGCKLHVNFNINANVSCELV